MPRVPVYTDAIDPDDLLPTHEDLVALVEGMTARGEPVPQEFTDAIALWEENNAYLQE
jgi:hypothetical protein